MAVILCISQDGLSCCSNNPENKWLKAIAFISLSHYIHCGLPGALLCVILTQVGREALSPRFMESGNPVQGAVLQKGAFLEIVCVALCQGWQGPLNPDLVSCGSQFLELHTWKFSKSPSGAWN